MLPHSIPFSTGEQVAGLSKNPERFTKWFSHRARLCKGNKPTYSRLPLHRWSLPNAPQDPEKYQKNTHTHTLPVWRLTLHTGRPSVPLIAGTADSLERPRRGPAEPWREPGEVQSSPKLTGAYPTSPRTKLNLVLYLFEYVFCITGPSQMRSLTDWCLVLSRE